MIDLRSALEDALEGMQEMLPYVPEYFQDKHELQDYIDRAQEALGNGKETHNDHVGSSEGDLHQARPGEVPGPQ